MTTLVLISSPVAASTPAAGLGIPELCARRGHTMRLVQETPRTFACAHDGCTHTAVVDEEVQP